MKRVEIIANRSVAQDLLAALDEAYGDLPFTLIPDVQGRGRQGVRRGDAVWPELNVYLLMFCEDDRAAELASAVRALKGRFPREGIKVFVSSVDCC